MKQALVLLLIVLIGLTTAHGTLGAEITYRVACGGIVLMSALIAATFLWLWRSNATPLALGMVFSWAGSALTLSWWWSLALRGDASVPVDHSLLLVFVSLHTAGAILHFFVIARSLHLPLVTAFAVPFAAFAASVAVNAVL